MTVYYGDNFSGHSHLVVQPGHQCGKGDHRLNPIGIAIFRMYVYAGALKARQHTMARGDRFLDRK